MKVSNQKLSEEFSKGNFEKTYDYMTDDIVWDAIGQPAVQGKADVVEYCEKMKVEMASAVLTNTNLTAENDTVVVEGFCQSANESGEPANVRYCDVYRFENEQLKHITSYCIAV